MKSASYLISRTKKYRLENVEVENNMSKTHQFQAEVKEIFGPNGSFTIFKS